MLARLAGKGIAGRLAGLESDAKALIRRAYIENLPDDHPERLTLRRFSLMSQNEEDGIIWSLLQAGVERTRRFVDFGCGNNGGNSGFLASELAWSGLMVDASEQRMKRARIRFDRPGVECVCSFLTREHVNDLLASHGFSNEIDLLSIDIDGNDYWIWEAIDVCSPRLVVIEYNALFGPERALVVPYDANFDRRADRTMRKGSMAYYGASIRALEMLACSKGYRLVAVEPRGVNAFFLRQDIAPVVSEIDPRSSYRPFYKYADRGIDLFAHVKEHDLPLIDLEAKS